MRIFYAETSAYYPSSAHFLEALGELQRERGWGFEFFDEARFAGSKSLAGRCISRLLGRRSFAVRRLNREFAERALRFRPDIVLIGKGSYLAPRTLSEVKRATGAALVNWATDDPFNPANGSPDLRAAIPLYDLYVCTKCAILEDIKRAGCANVAYVRFGYKPEVHFPEAPATAEERRRFECDVAFIGGADADRAPFFGHLMRAVPGLRLNLYGGYWKRYPALKKYARGNVYGRDYRLALNGAAINVNLVRRANRDDHVMRTFEIPACGAFMLTERSSTHEELFGDDREAAFFSDPAELADQVRRYIAAPDERSRIAQAGRRKIVGGHHSYRDRLLEIIGAVYPKLASRQSAQSNLSLTPKLQPQVDTRQRPSPVSDGEEVAR